MYTKHFTKVFFISIIVIISGFSFYSTNVKTDLEIIFGNRYYHSYEEDKHTAGIKVFRKEGYDFPPARGRRGFQLEKDGTFIAYEIAPADGPLPIKGKWKKTAKENCIKVVFEEADKEKHHVNDYFVEFLKIEPDKISLKITHTKD